MVTAKTKPTISLEGMEMLETILKPSAARVTKTHEELLVDEVKRYILSCVHTQLRVQ